MTCLDNLFRLQNRLVAWTTSHDVALARSTCAGRGGGAGHLLLGGAAAYVGRSRGGEELEGRDPVPRGAPPDVVRRVLQRPVARYAAGAGRGRRFRAAGVLIQNQCRRGFRGER